MLIGLILTNMYCVILSYHWGEPIGILNALVVVILLTALIKGKNND